MTASDWLQAAPINDDYHGGTVQGSLARRRPAAAATGVANRLATLLHLALLIVLAVAILSRVSVIL